MKKIDLFERAITEQAASLKDYGINATAFWAYRKSIEAGNDLVDFSEVIWDEDVAPIAETFRQNGITEFTISSTFSGLIPTLPVCWFAHIVVRSMAAIQARGITGN